MLPEVFPLLADDSEVLGFIGTTPVRCYRHGDAPQRVAKPYVTWFLASGRPENELDGSPKIDENTVGVSCWSDSDEEVEQLAIAVRNAIETEHHMISVGPNDRDPETMRYRITMYFTFWTDRP